ncbi:MAG TPA: CoA transferase [Terracidiphilus sp.]|nr:CoA transferase [Terracidiphilus sp.]
MTKKFKPISEVAATEDDKRASMLTQSLEASLRHPATLPDFDLFDAVNRVLSDVGMSVDDCGGKLSFYGRDPIVPSPLRYGTMAGVGLAARSVSLAALVKQATGEGQDISIDVRKALRRFCGFAERRWETINGRAPTLGSFAASPFLNPPWFNETRDGRHAVALDFYPGIRARTLNLLRCSESSESIGNAIRQWRSSDLEEAAAAAGVPMAIVRTNDELRQETQYAEVLSETPLITVEKIGESEAVPIRGRGDLPLCGIRALGMGHVIAGAAMGRCLALYGADVLNIWGLHACEIDFLAWDAQVGMRSTILGDSLQDRAQFHTLLQDTDVFFANKRPRFLEQRGLQAAELCGRKPGLIHATVVLHGETGPWAMRPGFDVHGATVSGVYPLEGTPGQPKLAPIGTPVCDNVVGWLGVTGILAALRRRATEGGSYRVVVSLTRTALWLLSLGIFDKQFAQATAGTSDEHFYPEPDLFTAETPCGTYQGMTDPVVMSRTKGSYQTVLVPMGSSKPEWLPEFREN